MLVIRGAYIRGGLYSGFYGISIERSIQSISHPFSIAGNHADEFTIVNKYQLYK